VVIHTDFSGNYIEDPIRNFDLVSSGMAHASLHIGINIDIKKYIKKYKRHKLQYYLEFEEPNKFWSKDWMLKLKNSHLFDNIFTLCPFTADYLNDRFYNENKCIPIFSHLINRKYLNQIKNKLMLYIRDCRIRYFKET
jgi:hypothetical protein